MLMKLKSLNYSFSIRERDIIFSSSRKSYGLKESRSFGAKSGPLGKPSNEFFKTIGKSASCFSLNLNGTIPERSAFVEETPDEKNEKADKKEASTFLMSRFGRNRIEETKVENEKTMEAEDEKLKDEVSDAEEKDKNQDSEDEIEESIDLKKKEKVQRQEPKVKIMQLDLRGATAYKKKCKRNKKQLTLTKYKYYHSPYLENISDLESYMPKSQRSQRKTKHKKIRATSRENEI